LHLKKYYEEIIRCIKNAIKGQKVWIAMDESIDSCGRSIANFVIGILSNDKEKCKSFVINTKSLESTNSTTIARFFEDTIHMVTPNVIERNDILLALTDTAPYMIKAMKALNVIYPKMLHLTCLAYLLNRVCEEMRSLFPNVDQLISNGKKLFTKSKLRHVTFKQVAPNIPLPPRPIIIRLVTWLRAATYYCKFYDDFHNVLIKELHDYESNTARLCNDLLESKKIRNDLAFITSHYGQLPDIIEKLETRYLPIYDSVAIYEQVNDLLSQVLGDIGNIVISKFKKSLSKNLNYGNIISIAKILGGIQIGGDNVYN